MYSIKLGSFTMALELHKDGTFIQIGKKEWWLAR
jgi:DNA-directed RNA polymerase delta subunit